MDLDTRQELGEGTEQEEPQEEGGDSEAEERAFKRMVSAVRRRFPRQQRFYIKPRGKFRPEPADGSGVGAGQGPILVYDVDLHMRATQIGLRFGWHELSSQDENGRSFIALHNYNAITYRYDLLERLPGTLTPSRLGSGWRLTDELPDTDLESGAVMADQVFASRWQRNPGLVLHHLIKKHEGELVELEGSWCRGLSTFVIDDGFFDPQFALTPDAYRLCKGLAKGKGKGAQELAVGSSGGKGKSKQEQRVPFSNRVLQLHENGEWRYRAGIATTLPLLLVSLGPVYTAAKLYKFYNQCTLLCTKRPHAWASPVRAAANHERFRATGRHGFGRKG